MRLFLSQRHLSNEVSARLSQDKELAGGLLWSKGRHHLISRQNGLMAVIREDEGSERQDGLLASRRSNDGDFTTRVERRQTAPVDVVSQCSGRSFWLTAGCWNCSSRSIRTGIGSKNHQIWDLDDQVCFYFVFVFLELATETKANLCSTFVLSGIRPIFNHI